MQKSDVSTLPDLSSEYALTPEQIAAYQKNGHIALRGVASTDEVAAYRPAIVEAAERYKTEKRALQDRDTYGKAFLQIMNLWTKDEAVKRFVFARRFARIAADLMGVQGVRLYHDQALFKEPNGGPTPWHQDQFYWPLDTDKTITLWMPLVDVTVEMGLMTFASRSQERGYLGKLPISDESQAKFNEFIHENGFSIEGSEVLHAGDATFHSGWVLHSAPGNQSSTMREAMTIIYFADGARITKPDHPNRENDLKSWLPGLSPGELAASTLNPLLYHR